jgi:hypothetical protein
MLHALARGLLSSGVRHHVIRFRWRKALISISIALWAITLVGVVVNSLCIPTFAEVGHLPRGCYVTDALWFYVRCTGFPGSSLVGSLLTLPYQLWLGPALFVFNPLLAVPLWFFMLYPVWYAWQRWRGA